MFNFLLPQVFDEVDDNDDFNNFMNNLGLDRPSTSHILKRAYERSNLLKQFSNDIMNKLKLRKGHSMGQELSAEDMENLTEEELEAMKEARNLQNEADRLSEDSLIMKAWKEHEKEQLRREQEAALKEMLKSASAEERDRILADFHDLSRRTENRLDDQKQRQQDKLIAKLAARKRMNEQLDRDRAVNQELDHITKNHVSVLAVGRSVHSVSW